MYATPFGELPIMHNGQAIMHNGRFLPIMVKFYRMRSQFSTIFGVNRNMPIMVYAKMGLPIIHNEQLLRRTVLRLEIFPYIFYLR